MVQRANLAAADGEGTPVTHTFTPYGDLVNGTLARWRNYNASNPAASEIMSLSVIESKSSMNDIMTFGRRVEPRVAEWRLYVPVTYVDGNSGLTQIDYPLSLYCKLMAHPRATEQQCKNLRVMGIGMAGQATNANQIIYGFDKGEPVW